MKTQFKFTRVYGRSKFYPSNEEARLLVRYAQPDKKCLNAFEFKRLLGIMKYGVTIEVFQEEKLMTFQELVPLLKKIPMEDVKIAK